MGITVKQLVPQSEWRGEWTKRIKALNNVPSLFRMVWEAAPLVVTSSVICRLAAAMVPLAILATTKYIIDSIYHLSAHQAPLPATFWWFVALEFTLASLAMTTARLIDFFDATLADKFTCYINLRIMEHASS